MPPWLPSWILGLKDLAILNLHVTLMPPIKFYCLEGDCGLKNFKMATIVSSLNIKTEQF